MNAINILPLIPEIFLTLTAMGFLIIGLFQGNRATSVICWASCVGLFMAFLLFIAAPEIKGLSAFGMVKVDAFSVLIKSIIALGAIASLAMSVRYLKQEKLSHFEYPVLVLFAVIGMMFMVSSNHFLSLYMAIELQSLSLYILTAFRRQSLQSAESASKYFILGALSSGLFLFGVSLIYGYVGALDFGVIHETIANVDAVPPGFIIGMVFVLVALAFKVSAAPFHMWTPDVYQGAPTSVTAFFAIVPKIVIIAVIARLLFYPFAAVQDQWVQILYVLCFASLIVGAFAPIMQRNIKRLFAYSSIGNVGYAMIGLLCASQIGLSAVIVFFLIYMIGTIGVFTIILSLRKGGVEVKSLSDLAGLSKTNPVIAYIMAGLMMSMIGVPPLAGFFGKLFIFQAAVDNGLFILAVFGIVASVVAAFYYLKIVKIMFFDDVTDQLSVTLEIEKRILLMIVTAIMLGFILMPSLLMPVVSNAVSVLF